MANFCSQCSKQVFGKDYGDFANLHPGRTLQPGMGWQVLCEECGPTIVNERGECIAKYCIRQHGQFYHPKEASDECIGNPEREV